MNYDNAAMPRLPLGQLTATPGALERAAACGTDIAALLARHEAGDWGDLGDGDGGRTRPRCATASGSWTAA